jgi:hypothetical protein
MWKMVSTDDLHGQRRLAVASGDSSTIRKCVFFLFSSFLPSFLSFRKCAGTSFAGQYGQSAVDKGVLKESDIDPHMAALFRVRSCVRVCVRTLF